jgi:hypothetical protein
MNTGMDIRDRRAEQPECPTDLYWLRARKRHSSGAHTLHLRVRSMLHTAKEWRIKISLCQK